MIGTFFTKHRETVVLVALLVASLSMMLATSDVELVEPKAFGQNFVAFFQKLITGSIRWTEGTFNSIGELREARRELEILRQRLQESERLSRDIVRLRRENTQLRELLGLSGELNFANIPAEVIGKQPGNSSEMLILNRGRRAGVERFMPVVAQQNGVTGLVGKVVTVGRQSSTVLPLSGETSFVAARLESSRYDGLLEGKGGFDPFVVMRNVSKLGVRDIEYGDLVVTSGLGQVFPAEIYIGRVRTIATSPYEPSLQLEVEPLIDLSRLEHVIILDTK